MFVWSARLSRIWPVLGVCVLAVIVVAAILLVRGTPAAEELPVASRVDAPSAVEPVAIGGKQEDRLAFLRQYGWLVDAEGEVEQAVTIPASFDEVYQAFNELQKEQGLDLAPYAGKTATSYTYGILNYPDAALDVFVELLIREGAVIGGEVYATGADTFEHGFLYERPTDRVIGS